MPEETSSKPSSSSTGAEKPSRRTVLKIAIAAIVSGVVAGVGAYFGGTATAPPAKTVTETKTVEKTVTAPGVPGATVTTTVTAPAATVTETRTVTAPAATVTETRTVTPTPKVPGEILLGSPQPLTGTFASWGIDANDTVKMLAEEWNKKGGLLGKPIRVIEYDIKELDAETVTGVFERLCTVDKVHGIYGIIPGYITGGVELDVTREYGVVYGNHNTTILTPERMLCNPDATKPEDTCIKSHWMNFMMDCPNIYYGFRWFAMLQELTTGKYGEAVDLPNNKYAILTATGAYDITVAESARIAFGVKGGWEEVLFEKTTYGVAEWGPTIAKLLADPPATIIITNSSPADCVAFQKQFNRTPTKSIVYCHITPTVPDYTALGGKEVDGVVWGVNDAIVKDEMGLDFLRRFRERWGREASEVPCCCGDIGFRVWASAVENAGTVEPREVAYHMLNDRVRAITGVYEAFRDDEIPMGKFPNMKFWRWPHTAKEGLRYTPFFYAQVWDMTHHGFYPPENPEGEPLKTESFRLPPWWKAGKA